MNAMNSRVVITTELRITHKQKHIHTLKVKGPYPLAFCVWRDSRGRPLDPGKKRVNSNNQSGVSCCPVTQRSNRELFICDYANSYANLPENDAWLNTVRGRGREGGKGRRGGRGGGGGEGRGKSKERREVRGREREVRVARRGREVEGEGGGGKGGRRIKWREEMGSGGREREGV